MIPVVSLWLPILLAAILVFVLSAITHMVLKYHNTDYGPLPGEDEVRRAMREQGVQPGEYVVPYAATPKEMGEPAYIAKTTEGPVALITVRESGPPTIGKQLGQWFVYCLIVSVFAAYVTSRAVGAGAEYLDVFRFAGTAAFLAYALGTWQETIWFGRSASTTLKNTFDGLIYALATAGVFGWLWP